MKKFKKLLALSLALAMGLSLCACSGKTPEQTPGDGETTEGTEGGTEEASTMEKPAAGGEKIYVYSWNTELGGVIDEFKAAYPEYTDDIDYVNLEVGGTSDEYKTKLEQLIKDNGAEVPSIFACDDALAKYFAESDYTVTMASIGLTDAMYAGSYDYTKAYGSVDGELKACTWQATPGCLLYRADIADAVLGVSEPDDVQEFVKDWDTFCDTAEKMKAAGYAMVSGPDDIKNPMLDQKTAPWVTDDVVTFDSTVSDYLEMGKKIYDAGYTKKTSQWTDAWTANMNEDVFCYFGCTWFTYWSLDAQSTMGQWRQCAGPVAYHWGGSYLTVTDNCPNKDLAAFIVYTLTCDADFMYEHFKADSDFVNNPAAMEKAIADGLGASDKLGGQNPVETWYESAKGIDLSNATSYDSSFVGFIDNAAGAFNSGELATVDDAMNTIKGNIRDAFTYLTVE